MCVRVYLYVCVYYRDSKEICFFFFLLGVRLSSTTWKDLKCAYKINLIIEIFKFLRKLSM